MTTHAFNLGRRRCLAGAAGVAGLIGSAGAFAAPALLTTRKPLRVTQLMDTSPDQQELSRDYSAGLRLAFAELAQGAARPPELVTMETDGSRASVQAALREVKDDPSQIALVGAVGEQLALSSLDETKAIGLSIANVAPWLADSRFDGDSRLFALFPSRETQIQHALKSLATMGVSELGLVYPRPGSEAALDAGIAQATGRLGLRTQRFTVPEGQDMAAYAAALPAASPVILLFLGGTVELALFSQGLSRRRLQRYVISLSDVNTTTLMQIGPGKGVPLIFTHVVPNPQSSSLPVARAYRAALQRLLDEAPSPMSLAGYLAGHYAASVLARVEAGAARSDVIDQFQRTPALDLGGFLIDFGRNGRGSRFVAETMLTGNGKLLG